MAGGQKRHNEPDIITTYSYMSVYLKVRLLENDHDVLALYISVLQEICRFHTGLYASTPRSKEECRRRVAYLDVNSLAKCYMCATCMLSWFEHCLKWTRSFDLVSRISIRVGFFCYQVSNIFEFMRFEPLVTTVRYAEPVEEWLNKYFLVCVMANKFVSLL